MTEAQEYNFSPEEQEVIKSHFSDWNRFLEEVGEKGDEVLGTDTDIDLLFGSSIDRDADIRSYFDYQELDIERLKENILLEDFLFREDESRPIQTKPGEIWICMSATPKDIYSPRRIGHYSDDFFVEQHSIYISNLGRGFEDVSYWSAPRSCLRLKKVIEDRYLLESLSAETREERLEPFSPVTLETLQKFQGLLEEIKANP